MCTKKNYEWYLEFPFASDLITADLGRDYYLLHPGAETTPEIIENYVETTNAYTAKKAIKDMKNLIAQIKQGKIDADEFIEEVGDGRHFDYKNQTNLEWFKDILKFLEENLQKYYGDES